MRKYVLAQIITAIVLLCTKVMVIEGDGGLSMRACHNLT
jgi:hypothetical protein